MADRTELARRFREAARDHESRSPLYSRLNGQIADRPAIVALLEEAPEEQQLPVLLLAAVHDIVLSEPDVELAAWYPTTTKAPRTTNPFPAFERLCVARGDEIRATVSTRSVQTNEVGRCALLLPALADVAADQGPLALIDVGASAGLNLLLDKFEYVYMPGGRVGTPSTVLIECGVRGELTVPHELPTIASGVGLDRHPIDVSDPAQARWLSACVWPDQPDRFGRLRGAIELAQQRPPRLICGDAVDSLPDLIREGAAVGHPVVVNSWMLNYLPEHRQHAYLAVMDALGQQMDLSWIAAESPGLCPALPVPPVMRNEHITAVISTRWRDGHRTSEYLGTAHPHGYWIHPAA